MTVLSLINQKKQFRVNMPVNLRTTILLSLTLSFWVKLGTGRKIIEGGT